MRDALLRQLACLQKRVDFDRTHRSSRAVIGRCLLLLSHDEEMLFSHVADAISVLVDENEEHLCENHTGSHNGSVANVGTIPQEIGTSSSTLPRSLGQFCSIGNRTF
jgi:hypothetical protein